MLSQRLGRRHSLELRRQPKVPEVNVGYWPKADIPSCTANSAFGGKANTKTDLMARLEIVIHFATNSSFAQTPNYVSGDAPPIKSAHLF
jgi:hypothetical protein